VTADPVLRAVAALARNPAGSSDFDLNPGLAPSPGRVLRPAAVLVAVCDRPGGPQVLLTKRASGLKHHPGQIAFPGGKVDAGDASHVAAALREAQEETGLDPALVQVLATLPHHETVTGFDVAPVLARVTAAFDPACEPGEVEEAFFVPLRHVTDPASFRVERRIWRGQMRAYFTVPYGPYYIWGATARILRRLADLAA
jgi:8-oxo-dGTP pyrophosphatase MutT (NUDIX family)